MSEITQADREAAATLAWSNGQKNTVVERFRAGANDDLPAVQAFANHRIQARKEALSDALLLVKNTYVGSGDSPCVKAVLGIERNLERLIAVTHQHDEGR